MNVCSSSGGDPRRVAADDSTSCLDGVFNPAERHCLRYFAVDAREGSRAAIAEGNRADDLEAVRLCLNEERSSAVALDNSLKT